MYVKYNQIQLLVADYIHNSDSLIFVSNVRHYSTILICILNLYYMYMYVNCTTLYAATTQRQINTCSTSRIKDVPFYL